MEKGYMISDASRILEVENHVLRYWEEELELPIPRNEMGHRYYREPEIKLLRSIKDLKEQGFQLKAIKKLLPDLERLEHMDPKIVYQLREELNNQVMREAMEGTRGTVTPIEQARDRYEKRQRSWQERSFELEQVKDREAAMRESRNQAASLERLRQFEKMLQQMIRGTMEEMSHESEKRICEEVSVKLQKEMNYLLLQKEELQEKQIGLLKEILAQVRREEQGAAQQKQEAAEAGQSGAEKEVAATTETSGEPENTEKGSRRGRKYKKAKKKKLFAKSVS